MSRHWNRHDRVAVVFERTDGLADETFVRQMAGYIFQTYGEGADPSADIIDCIGYLTATCGQYISYLSAPAYATLVGYAAEASDLPPNVNLVRVEWPGKEPIGGWGILTYVEVIDGQTIVNHLPQMS